MNKIKLNVAKIVVPRKTEEEINEDIKEELEKLKDFSYIEKRISSRFFEYIFKKYNKTTEDILNDINEKIKCSNEYRKKYNEEILKTIYKDNLDLKMLAMLNPISKIPDNYYLYSIYTDDFFDEFKEDKILVKNIEKTKLEEKLKKEREDKYKNQIQSYKLILKYKLGFSNEDINELDDEKILLIIKEAFENNRLNSKNNRRS